MTYEPLEAMIAAKHEAEDRQRAEFQRRFGDFWKCGDCGQPYRPLMVGTYCRAPMFGVPLIGGGICGGPMQRHRYSAPP